MSRSVAVVTPAYTTDENAWYCLLESATRNGIKLHVLGGHAGYPGPVEVFREFIPLVEDLPDDYVLFTDSYDVIVNRWDAEEVMRAVDAAPSGLVVSCNDECWPVGPWCDSYPDNGTPWRTACGGQYVGRKAAVVNLWREFLSGRWEQTSGGSTQEMLHRMYAHCSFCADEPNVIITHGYPFTLDTKCQIFQIMGSRSVPFVDIFPCSKQGLVARNTWTVTPVTHPMFLHFGGRAPGMRKWYERLYS
eukprot:GHVR01021829.1.p1 GENE.GHVR01021829.1~~GHVR01021829.1.p1  ORF type:complete len:247 (+),score=23.34 GHVR01021829.1:441-1181(+)